MSQLALIYAGSALSRLADMPDRIARCCVTSPPYWGLRDYGVDGQLGLEPAPDEYVANLVEVFRQVRRVLTDDGTLWLNLGDSYAGSGKGGNPSDSPHQKQATNAGSTFLVGQSARDSAVTNVSRRLASAAGYKSKDLIGIPWMVAFALRSDGWFLRSEIIWHKPNPMPESVTDRPTKAHETVFLLSKSARYFHDAAAVAEPVVSTSPSGNGFVGRQGGSKHMPMDGGPGTVERWQPEGKTRNRRSVWTVVPKPFKGAHFATYPTALVEPCVLAGSQAGDMVLDPFAGSGTTGVVALNAGRDFVGVELNASYVRDLLVPRLAKDAGTDAIVV